MSPQAREWFKNQTIIEAKCVIYSCHESEILMKEISNEHGFYCKNDGLPNEDQIFTLVTNTILKVKRDLMLSDEIPLVSASNF